MTRQNALRRNLARLLRQLERGEDESFEFTALITPIMVLLMMIAFAVLVRSSQMPAWTAASECARAAIATLDEEIGRAQGLTAAYDSLNGSFVRASTGSVSINGTWTPFSNVTCTVTYDIDVSGITFFADLTGGRVPVTAVVTMQVEPHKSRWQ